MRKTDCKHTDRSVKMDHHSCNKCRYILTDSDSSWGVAKSKWFKSMDEAILYRDTGRLPDEEEKKQDLNCKEDIYETWGWKIRTIKAASENSVTLDDSVSFSGHCFAGAQVGDIWAVKHEKGDACFGKVRQAILLQPAGRD
jgi:hypothetical protein